MADKKPADTIIMVHETTLQSWARDLGTFALFAALIGIGIAAGSPAMQWAGAVMAFVATMIRSSGKVLRLSVAQARAKLDEIERRD